MMRKEDYRFRPFVLKVLPNLPPESKTHKVIVKVPAPFPYPSNHAIPWNYGVKVEMVKGKLEDQGVSQKDDGVINVGATAGFTRSGRYYLPNDIQKQKDKGKGKGVIKGNPITGRKEKDPEDLMDDEEFLKVLKHSEYNIVDQLKKTPARVSLLSLIMSSEAHRKTLQKFLDQAYVNPSITVENFDNMVNLIKKVGTISFIEDELVPGASTHTRALHIALKCAGCVVAKGKGLRAYLQGINAPVSLPENVGKQGLGYSSLVDPKENNLSDRDGMPHLCQTFTKSSDIMASLKDEELMPVVNMSGEGAGNHPWIRPFM
ncbi:hypothetical protein L6164_001169 [Bauhinia variegata]|uniref:Uncharacterized protein n=1 Tax=Bauhinia variegata TaxID=167791 RepID=A0ACB9Q895_BAUVA|nr:hypothetical protein L6164_001169 [Bauhinia variegata]